MTRAVSDQALCLVSPRSRRGLEYAIEAYLADCQVRNLAPRTIVIYRQRDGKALSTT